MILNCKICQIFTTQNILKSETFKNVSVVKFKICIQNIKFFKRFVLGINFFWIHIIEKFKNLAFRTFWQLSSKHIFETFCVENLLYHDISTILLEFRKILISTLLDNNIFAFKNKNLCTVSVKMCYKF